MTGEGDLRPGNAGSTIITLSEQTAGRSVTELSSSTTKTRRRRGTHLRTARPLLSVGTDDAVIPRQPTDAAPGSGRGGRRLATAALVAGDATALLGALALTGRADNVSLSYVVLTLLVLTAASAYRRRINLGALDEAPRTATLLAVPLLLIAPFASHDAGRVMTQALVSVGTVSLGRSAAYAALRAARRRGLSERTLIAGSGHVGIDLAHLMRAHPEYGLDLVGFVGTSFPNLPAPLLGDIDRLDDVITRHAIRRVLVAFGRTREAELVGVLRTAVLHDVEVYVVPRFFEIGVAPRGPGVEDLWGIPVYRVRQAALRAHAWRFKRALDIAIASLGIVIAAPVMAISAVAIKLSSRGPILFRQRRVGQHGRDFEVLKFRTLPAGHVDSSWNADSSEYSTSVGRVLRRLSIDELPQLWNVLQGNMSLVGPRPERGYLVARFNDSIDGYTDRHRLPAGLTGWAQVHGLRGDTSLRERVRFDNQYIEHWSLWRDIIVLMRTTTALFRTTNKASVAESQLPAASHDPAAVTTPIQRTPPTVRADKIAGETA